MYIITRTHKKEKYYMSFETGNPFPVYTTRECNAVTFKTLAQAEKFAKGDDKIEEVK